MKKVLKFLFGLIITIYVVCAVFLTGCLLNLNDFGVTIFANRTLIIVENDELEPLYKKGSLIIAKKNNFDEVKVGDDVFFYNTYEKQVYVSHAGVIKTTKVNEEETTFTLEGNYDISGEYFIGKAQSAFVINGVGSILSVLESKMGFLFIIILPCSILFMYEIYRIIIDITNPDNQED